MGLYDDYQDMLRDFFDSIDRERAEVDGALEGAFVDLNRAKGELSEARATNAALADRVQQLEKQIAEQQPPKTVTLAGAYNGTSSTSDTQFEQFGLKATIATSYYTVSGPRPMPVPQAWDVARLAKGIFPQVHFQSTQNGVQSFFWQDVADGKHDQWFAEMAKKLHKDFGGRPFSFTFDGEPETRIEKAGTGNWIQKDPRNTPASYAAAFRRVVTVMRPHAPAMDSRWWVAGHIRNTTMDAYYPGDEYVDSIAVDPYVWGHDAPTTGPYEKWEPVVNFFRDRYAKGKPVGISETGFARVHGDDAQAAFWAKVPDAVRRLNLSWVVLFNRGDFKMDDLPEGRAAFIQAMNSL